MPNSAPAAYGASKGERWPNPWMTISTPSGVRWDSPIEEAWRPAIRANLEVSLRLAKLVDDYKLPDEFRAGQCLHRLIPPR